MIRRNKQAVKLKMVPFVLVISIILWSGGYSICFTSLASPAKSWTFIVYLDADNNLEGAGIKDLNEMELVGSSSSVDIVVQIDRIPGYDDSNGDWTGTRRYYVTKDSDHGVIQSNLVQDLGEANMAAENTLSSFVKWAIQNYPADHYALILWDHGGGFPGVCWDDTDGGDSLTMVEIKQALSDIKGTTGVGIDVLGFDACLMGMVEVAHQIKNYANFMIGSEETEPNDGYPYDTILADLTSNSSMTPNQLAATIVAKYVASYTDELLNPEDAPTVTQAAYNLAEEPALANAVSTFSQILADSFNQYKNEVVSARSQTEQFQGDFIDLYDFTQRVRNSIANVTIQSAADNVLNKLASFIITEGHGQGHPNSHGATIYYPEKYNKASYAGSETDKTLDFPWDTLWDEFLDFGTNVEANLVPQFPTYTMSGNTTIADVAAGDVDGDGAVEVVGVGAYTDDYGDVYFVAIVFEVTETELVMQSNYTLNLGESEELTSLKCADADNDLKDEIIITADFYNLTDYGWYSCIIILDVNAEGITLQMYNESAYLSLESLDVADVDGDGYNEIVISGHLWDEFGDEYAYIAVGNNSLPSEMALENYYAWNIGTGEDIRAVAVGDTDGDGQAEIVVGGIFYDVDYDLWYGYVAVLNFTSNLFWMQAFDYGQDIWINSVEIADVNGDMVQEIVVSGYSWDANEVYFYIGIAINQPSETIAWLYQDVYSIGENEELVSVDVADIEGDGVAEIIVSGYYFDDYYGEWDGYQAVFSWSETTGMVLEDAYYGEDGNDYTYSLTTANIDNDAQTEVISCDSLQTDVSTGQINVQTASNYVPETGAITGTVTDGVNPISGATVQVAISRYSVVATTTTLANGSYTLGDLQPASYDIEVHATGKLNETQKGVLVNAGETTTAPFELENTPITSDNVVIAEGFTFHVITLSNSTVTSFAFSKDQKEISFNITGSSGTEGFCNATIPNSLLDGNLTVKIDGVQVAPDPIITSNATHSFVYFTYGQSTRKIQIIGTTVIPEFPIIITLLLLLAATLIAVILTKRKLTDVSTDSFSNVSP